MKKMFTKNVFYREDIHEKAYFIERIFIGRIFYEENVYEKCIS